MNHLSVTEERFEPLSLPQEEVKHYVRQTTNFRAVIAIDKCMAYRAFDEMNASNVDEEEDRFLFTVENANENWITGYVLSYGQHAEVISPPKLREEIVKTIEVLTGKYGANGNIKTMK